MPDFRYVGSELDVFRHALRWKSYVRRNLKPFLVGDVLEVGAGIGAATQAFNDGSQRSWVCLEPDESLAQRIPRAGLARPENCQIVVGSLRSLGQRDTFDCVLYMDVLEHIEDDASELALAASHLKPGGALIVLAPALPWLYSPFDAAIGHFRRYTKRSLRAIAPRGFTEVCCRYLDAVGLLASAGNRLFLRSGAPTVRQIIFWDRCLVPLSRLADTLLLYSAGRSVLAVWRKLAQA